MEKIQRRCTKVGPMRGLPYNERLNELCLTTLEVRRIRGNVTSIFRYFKGFDRMNFENPPRISTSKTWGQIDKFKLDKEYSVQNSRRNFHFCRALDGWNSLPTNVIYYNTVVEFKKCINSPGIFQCHNTLITKNMFAFLTSSYYFIAIVNDKKPKLNRVIILNIKW